ncbi:hypothetical protein CH289_17360 [Rhodococcus sp. RS1C4]|nr:hypothetical protein [Rhodococcus sp. RS1C4]OZC49304.1 hypothetical protein CH289_17360 [Rhodococcus sp. RS1C4]
MQGFRAGTVEALEIEQKVVRLRGVGAGGRDGDAEVAGGVLAADAGLLGDGVRGDALIADCGVEVAGGDDEFQGPGWAPRSCSMRSTA